MSVDADHDVFRLKIAISDGWLVGMHVLEGEKNFSGVESHLIFVKLPVALQEREKISTGHEVENEEVLIIALKCKMEADDEDMRHLRRVSELQGWW